MTTQENELFVTIRNDKGEPICTVEWAVAERLGWLEEQGAAEGDKAAAPAAAPERAARVDQRQVEEQH